MSNPSAYRFIAHPAAFLLVWVAMALMPRPAMAREALADIHRSVGDAEQIFVGQVDEIHEDGWVAFAAERHLKGAEAPRVLVHGETGFCVVHGPVGRFVEPGQRYLVFLFEDGAPGRLGHFQPIGPEGRLPEPDVAMMHFGADPPQTEQELIARIEHIQSPAFARQQLAELQEAEPQQQIQIIERLGRARAEGAMEALLAIAQQPVDAPGQRSVEHRRRWAAIEALGRLRQADAVQPLIELMAAEPKLTSWVARALGEIGDDRAVPPLTEALQTTLDEPQYEPTSVALVEALGRIGRFTGPVRQVLHAALDSPHGQVAETVAQLARQREAYWLVPALAEKLKAGDETLRQRAGVALAALAGVTWPVPQPEAPVDRERALQLARQVVQGRTATLDLEQARARPVAELGWLVSYASKADAGGPRSYIFVRSAEAQAVWLYPRLVPGEEAELPEAYAGFARDLAQLDDTTRLSRPVINASSAEAVAAAQRVFAVFPEPGTPGERVLAVLGDPERISDYNPPASEQPAGTLTYRFDTGWGGVQYVIQFQDGRVTQVQEQGLQ